MPVLAFAAMFATPEVGCPMGARIRYGNPKARRIARERRPRRTCLDLSVLTTSGPHQATLAALTLYSATLEGRSRLRRRELIALRLPSGRRVKARVRWRLGRRCGVTLLTPVADFAQLLRECRAAQGAHEPRHRPVRSRFQTMRFDWPDQVRNAIIRTRRLCRQLLRWCRTL